ncbi:uncharacterized protein LOC128723951 [Anopheles nili]|uniref:uncharacterized protein LOC128723951 n=1 Tax=Anopheles nili TaxID=185578 RepID=UPI00237BE104|nr:uncharacterized protein LOC128723951 [Anopheles nili]
MANLPNKFRGIVSGQRKRYKEDGFNLDLSYIKDNIIAMGFPAENVEAIYRNNREDVLKLLTEKHGNKYKVYNLCSERTYGATLFPHYAEYPFKDHNPPDIELIIKFCEDVHNYLCADSSHVVAIHCKAGKGRTGTMICCYLLYSNAFQTANEALTYYAEKRTKDKKGVTIPSQRRYVEYYEQLLRNRLTYHDVTLYILEVRISPVDVSIRSGSIKMKGATESVPLQEFQRTGDYSTVVLDRCMPLTGDVKVELCRSKLQEKRMHFWFNTFFVMRAAIYDSQERLVLTLDRMEIDDAHKGNTKKCPEQVQVFLKPVPPSGRYSENLEANRMLPALPQQPMIDSNPTYATPNNIAHLDYQQQQQQKHHMGLMKSTNHNQSLIPNANYSEGQQHHRTANNNRTSLGNSQQNSGIYCNINLNPTGLGDAIQQQQQQQQHGAAAASSQQQPQLRYHSAGSSEENSGTDSVGDEEGWESGECQTVVSQTMCKSKTTATTSATTANTATATSIGPTETTATPSTTKPHTTQPNQTSSNNCVARSPPPAAPESVAATIRATSVAEATKTCISPSPSNRRCISDDENYLLWLYSSASALISKSSISSTDPPLAFEHDQLSSKHNPPISNQALNLTSCNLPPGVSQNQGQEQQQWQPRQDSNDVPALQGGDSLAVMLYDERSLPFGYGGASGFLDHRLQESQSLRDAGVMPLPTSSKVVTKSRAGTHVPGFGKSDEPTEGVAYCRAKDSTAEGVANATTDTERIGICDVDTGSGGGSGDGKSKLASTSPFRRFGMAMKRKKKRSLKLKHATSGSNGGIGGNALYGSCASNLSGVSIGNGSVKGVGGVAGAASTGNNSRMKLKFRWLLNMRSDPHLKETLAKSVQLRPTNAVPMATTPVTVSAEDTKGAASSSSVAIPRSPTVSVKVPIPNSEDAVLDRDKVAACGNIPTDYYSFICDNQLSYESPSKSPGHLMRLELALARRPSTIEEVLLNPSGSSSPPPSSPVAIAVSSTDTCSVVKPKASNVKIGFNVSPAPLSPAPEAAEDLTSSIESSFEIIDKNDALMVPSVGSSPPIAGNTGETSSGGQRFCNKLLQHLVTSVSSGLKTETLTPLESPVKDVDRQPHQPTEVRRSCPSASSAMVMTTHPLTSRQSAPNIGGSPILTRNNRCAPFSFRELRAELRAAMKIPKYQHHQRTQGTAGSSSSSSSSSSNIIGGGAVATTLRSIERTLSAPVAVQTLASGVTGNENISPSLTSAPCTTTTSTTNVVNAATPSAGTSRLLNRSFSDQQIIGNTSSRSTSFFTNLKLCRKIKQIFPNFTPGRPELMASTSMATGLQASGLQDDQRRQSMMQVCSSFLRRSLSSTAGSIRSKLQSVKSSSASYDFQTSSVSSASSQSVCRDQQSIGEITSSEEMLLPQSCVVGGTAENTYDSALTTSSPSHNEQESQATFDEQQLVAKISSLNEQQLQRTLGDELDSTLSQRSVVPDSGNETPTERVQNHAHSAVQHDQLITQLGEKFKEF